MERTGTIDRHGLGALNEAFIGALTVITPVGLLIIVASGHGGGGGGYLVKLLSTMMVMGVVAGASLLNPAFGVVMLASLMWPVKLLANMDAISNSTLNLLALLVGYLYFMRVEKVRDFRPGMVLFVLFFAVMTLQAARTSAPMNSVKLLFGAVNTFVMFYVVMPRLDASRSRQVVRAFLAGSVATVLFLLLTYDWGAMERMGGEMMNSNNIGQIAAMSIVLLSFFFAEERTRTYLVPALLLFAAVLFLSGSRTFMAATALGLFMLLRYNRRLLVPLVLLSAGLVGLLAVINLEDSLLLHHISKGLDVGDGDSPSLMGVSTLRLLLLAQGIDAFLSNPLAGVGLANFSTITGVYSMAAEHRLIAHNIYLSTAVELGAVGLALLIAWNVSLVRFLRMNYRPLAAGFTLMIFFVGLISGNYLDMEYALIWSAAFLITLGKGPERERRCLNG